MQLRGQMASLFNSCFQLVAGLGVVVATSPFVLLLLPPLFIAYRSLQAKYSASAREVQRLQSISRSPILQEVCVCVCVNVWEHGEEPFAELKSPLLLRYEHSVGAFCNTSSGDRDGERSCHGAGVQERPGAAAAGGRAHRSPGAHDSVL